MHWHALDLTRPLMKKLTRVGSIHLFGMEMLRGRWPCKATHANPKSGQKTAGMRSGAPCAHRRPWTNTHKKQNIPMSSSTPMRPHGLSCPTNPAQGPWPRAMVHWSRRAWAVVHSAQGRRPFDALVQWPWTLSSTLWAHSPRPLHPPGPRPQAWFNGPKPWALNLPSQMPSPRPCGHCNSSPRPMWHLLPFQPYPKGSRAMWRLFPSQSSPTKAPGVPAASFRATKPLWPHGAAGRH